MEIVLKKDKTGRRALVWTQLDKLVIWEVVDQFRWLLNRKFQKKLFDYFKISVLIENEDLTISIESSNYLIQTYEK